MFIEGIRQPSSPPFYVKPKEERSDIMEAGSTKLNVGRVGTITNFYKTNNGRKMSKPPVETTEQDAYAPPEIEVGNIRKHIVSELRKGKKVLTHNKGRNK